jgi:hypothetical protein
VASGGVHVMAGIMFAMNGSNVELSGFLRMGGYVSVLGLISLSIELDMDLNYYSDSNVVIGQATITVEVSVLFFHQAVQISCQKQFAGPPQDAKEAPLPREAAIPLTSSSDNSITFKDLMQPEGALFPWRDYCRAFA